MLIGLEISRPFRLRAAVRWDFPDRLVGMTVRANHTVVDVSTFPAAIISAGHARNKYQKRDQVYQNCFVAIHDVCLLVSKLLAAQISITDDLAGFTQG
jgi:hypothetical protein